MTNEDLATCYAFYAVEILDYQELINRAFETIRRDVLDGLSDGSLVAQELIDEIGKD